MPATITLTATRGALSPRRFVFRNRGLLTVGRSLDCGLHLPSTEEFLDVSRHHCLLNIDPPHLRVSDFGSLNGTFVNGINIGQRAKGLTPEEVFPVDSAEFDLEDGDELRLGHTVFRVEVSDSAVGSVCGAAIAKDQAEEEPGPSGPRCPACRQEAFDYRHPGAG
jgi:pSer/pThr/pTyr-binding forkhead associated (FHA) protein